MNQTIGFEPGTVSETPKRLKLVLMSLFQAFGGHKQSGLGLEGGIHGLKSYTNMQTVTLKKSPAVPASA